MHGFSLFLIAFGGACGIAAWFLFQKTLSRLVQHLQRDHNQTWIDLGRPNVDSPAYSAISNTKLRQYILKKEYVGSTDLFVQDIGGLLRQRLLFCLFCLVCLIVGIVLMLMAITIEQMI